MARHASRLLDAQYSLCRHTVPLRKRGQAHANRFGQARHRFGSVNCGRQAFVRSFSSVHADTLDHLKDRAQAICDLPHGQARRLP